MKKYIILLILFTNFSSCSQSLVHEDKGLEGFVTSFIEEGNKRGCFSSDIVYKRVTSVEFANLKYPMLGRYYPHSGVIQIFPFVQVDGVILKVIVYHELGHAVKGTTDHSCKDCNNIMSTYSSKGFAHFFKKDNMEREIDTLFQWLDIKHKSK